MMAEASNTEWGEVAEPHTEAERFLNLHMSKGGRKSTSRVRREDDYGNPSDHGESFDHPVYKKLSRLNGDINKMTKNDLKERLASLGLDPRGVKEVLKKRLKSYYKRSKFQKAGFKAEGGALYDNYLVIDFEATCDENNGFDWKHEIIEFPIVRIDGKTQEVVDEFHSFVRPVLKPKLTKFCTELTGITQRQVDSSPPFPEVLKRVETWMAERRLGQAGNSVAIVTDGPWDMGRFMFLQCQISSLPFPRWARKWVNLRKAYCNFYKFKKAKLVTMLENLGMTFQGHQHSGLDDTRNISRIAQRMLKDGSPLKVNERVFQYKLEELGQFEKSEVVAIGANEESASGSECEEDSEVVFQKENELEISHWMGDGSCQENVHAAKKSEIQLAGDMGKLTLHNDSEIAADTSDLSSLCNGSSFEDVEEEYDDLLAYYALQNQSKG